MNSIIRNAYILSLMLLYQGLMGQQKSAKPNSTKPEIDRIAEKYNSPTVTLTTSQGDLIADCEIEYDVKNKPRSVEISGRSDNQSVIIELLVGTINQKTKQGYKPDAIGKGSKELLISIEKNIINQKESERRFAKGKLLFTIKYGQLKFSESTEYWFIMATVDTSRLKLSSEIEVSSRIENKKSTSVSQINTTTQTSSKTEINKPPPRTIIQMEKINGVFVIPCSVNSLALKFIFDTGAGDVSISSAEAIFMLKNGYLKETDLKGTELYKLANGEIEKGTNIILREIKIGDITLKNVKASIVHSLSAPLLLGLSAFETFGSIEFNPSKKTLTIR